MTYEEDAEDEAFIKVEANSRVKKLIDRLRKPETFDVHQDVTQVQTTNTFKRKKKKNIGKDL